MTKEGVASLRAARARTAKERAAGTGYFRTHRGGPGGVGRTLYFYNPKTGHYTYRVGGGAPGGGWILLGEKQPKGWVGGQARGVAIEPTTPEVKEIMAADGKKYYYDPVTRVATTKAVEGQEAMTKAEVLTVIRRMPRKTKVEYGEQYREYREAKRDVQQAELAALAEPMPSLQEAIALPTTTWGPRISKLPLKATKISDLLPEIPKPTYKEDVSRPTLLHTTKRYGLDLPIVEITPKWLRDIAARKEQEAEKQKSVAQITTTMGAAALAGSAAAISVITSPIQTGKDFIAFGKMFAKDMFGTGALIRQQLETRPVSMIAEIAGYRAGLKFWGTALKPVVSYAKPEIATIKLPTDKGIKTVYKGLGLFERPIVGIAKWKKDMGAHVGRYTYKLTLGTGKGVDLTTATKPFIVESAAATKLVLRSLGEQKLVSPTGLTKLTGLVTLTRTVETTPSKYVVDKFLKQTETWNKQEITKILDFTKKYQGDLFGSFAAYQQTKPSLRRVGADIDVMFDMPKPEMELKAQELANQLTKLGAKVKVKGIGIHKYIPDVKKWVHGVDIKLKDMPDISKDAAKEMSEALKGDKVYGAPLGQPTIEIEKTKVMPLSEQVVRKMSSIGTIRPSGAKIWEIAPEPHRMKDIPDWFRGYETLAGKQALELRKLYPAELFKDYGKKIAGKTLLYRYTEPKFRYPSRVLFFGLKEYPSLYQAKKTPVEKMLDYKYKYPTYPKVSKPSLIILKYPKYPTYPKISKIYPTPSKKYPTYPSRAGAYPPSYPPSKPPSKPSPYDYKYKKDYKIDYYKDYHRKDYYKDYYNRFYRDYTGGDIVKTFHYPKIKKTPFIKKRELKKKKHRFGYSPSLIAGMERIQSFKLPIRITGLGIRPKVIGMEIGQMISSRKRKRK